MTAFATSDDVRRIFGGFFQEFVTGEGAAAFAGSGAVLGYESTDPQATIVIDGTATPAAVYVDDSKAPAPHVTLRASAATLDKLLSGELNPMMAMMSGKVKIGGDTSVAMRLMPVMNAVIPSYKAYRASH